MPDFTQGKWGYDENSGVICSQDTKAVIAKVKDAWSGGCFGVTAEGITNALLITAAPEMYQWIEDARSFLSNGSCAMVMKMKCAHIGQSFAEPFTSFLPRLIYC